MIQAFLFHLEEHPKVHGYYQCVTFHSFRSTFHKLLYNVANMCAMYACPLVTFIYCYGAIYLEIYRKAKPQPNLKGIGVCLFPFLYLFKYMCLIKRFVFPVELEHFRRSNDNVLCRAKKRTLKMTITIVIVFTVCWTPYYIICLWYWIDRSSVDKVSSLVRKALFIFACTNSCMNPIVYGIFNIRPRPTVHGRDALGDTFQSRGIESYSKEFSEYSWPHNKHTKQAAKHQQPSETKPIVLNIDD